jgi:DNA polymerase I-like protein with 3'-5' exonuclease and polymerase domains
MIYFVTNCPKHYEHYSNNFYNEIEVIKDDAEALTMFKNFVTAVMANGETHIGYDKETNGLDAWKNSTILDIVGNNEVQFVFHTAFCPRFLLYLDVLRDTNMTLIGHNIKFDLKFLIAENQVIWRNVYDTMIAEQRLYMGADWSNSLDAVVYRTCKVYENVMDKSIREEFIGCNPKTFTFDARHIRYAAGDVEHLNTIRLKQEDTMINYGMKYLIKEIEFPLIHIVAKAEVTGFEFDLDAWLQVYYENKEKQFNIECELDIELRRVRDMLKDSIDVRLLTGGKWDNVRKKTIIHDLFNDDDTVNMLDLFGNQMTKTSYTRSKSKKIIKNPNNVQYTSDAQIVEIFARLEQPLPTKEKVFAIPKFNKKGKIDKTRFTFQTGEPALQEYLSEYPNTIMRDFILLLFQHRGLATACNNFGINFKSKINPVTGKLHTIFRQAHAKTGRFQCGGGRNEKDKPNFQNIPSKAKYAKALRNCFKAREGYSILTHDLTGAELVIMCSLSQDMKLLEVSKGDMHSYMAQGAWRRIYAHRANERRKILDSLITTDIEVITTLHKEIEELEYLANNYVVNKETTKDVRTAFKPMGFGGIYGMYALKASKTLTCEMAKVGINNPVTKEEGQIVLDYLEEEFPDVFKMVKAASAFARQHGYLILNSRTNSRAWFPRIIECNKRGLSDYDAFMIINKELSEARNKRIQGTQADMIKEMSVEIQNWIYENNFEDDITILSWVHDEIVSECPKYMDGKSDEWRLDKPNLSYKGTKFDNFPDLKAHIMSTVGNKYLENVTIEADYEVEPFWTK